MANEQVVVRELTSRALRVAWLYDHLTVKHMGELLRMVAARVTGEDKE